MSDPAFDDISEIGRIRVAPRDAVCESTHEQPPVHPPRQDNITDQLRDLIIVARQMGMHEAADWIEHHIVQTEY